MRKYLFHNEKAQALVEITLILPVILVLFLGIAEVGFILYAHVQVANATREGARYGSLCRFNGNCLGGSGYADLTEVVESAVFAEAQVLKMDNSNTIVKVQPPSLSSPPPAGTPLTVTVTYSHSLPFVSNFVPMFPAEISLQHHSVMNFDK
jgi:Flp pilus assembly protein TadG